MQTHRQDHHVGDSAQVGARELAIERLAGEPFSDLSPERVADLGALVDAGDAFHVALARLRERQGLGPVGVEPSHDAPSSGDLTGREILDRRAALRITRTPGGQLHIGGRDARTFDGPLSILGRLAAVEATAIDTLEAMRAGGAPVQQGDFCDVDNVPGGEAAGAAGPRLSPCGKGTNCNGGPRAGLDAWQPGSGAREPGFEEGAFLGRVERLTVPFREGRHTHHVERADEFARLLEWSKVHPDEAGEVERVRDGERTWIPAADAYEASMEWHRQRAEGQLRRFQQVAHCGEGAVHVRCTASRAGGPCGWEAGIPLGCGCHRVCVPCRDRRAAPERERFARAREAVLHHAQRAGLNRRRLGGRYTEKHLTLTIPDGYIRGEGAVSWRVHVLYDAWRRFSVRLRKWLKERELPIWYYRGFEWTGGADGQGHPHFHVWLFSPYLPVGLLHWWWVQSLTECGVLVCGEEHARYFGPGGRARRNVRPTGPLVGEQGEAAIDRRGAFVVLDVRQVTVRRSPVQFEIIKGGRSVKLERPRLRVEGRGGQDLIAYIGGWMVSDRDDAGGFVSAEVNAELYEALEGRKQVRASDGFLALGEQEARCPCCSAAGRFQTSIVAWQDPEVDTKREAIGLPSIRAPAGADSPRGPGLRDVRDRRAAAIGRAS